VPVTTQIRSAPCAVAIDGTHRPAFESPCPKCGHRQPQRRFSRTDLFRLLNGGYPIEAYCPMCDDFWSISLAERVVIAMQVSKPIRAKTCISRRGD
jgi:hypothetical protein